MKGVLYVVTEADGSEGLRSVDQLKGLEVVEEPKPEPVHTPRRIKRKKRTPKRDDRWVEYAGHCAAGTDPVTSAVATGLFDKDNKSIKIDWGRKYGPNDMVPLGEALYWAAGMGFIFWWIVKFAI